MSPAVLLGYKVSGDTPQYPDKAKSAGVQGVVILEATISKAGSIRDLSVVSGPLLLQDAALNAVKSWRYKPYLLNGEPVEVQTLINVIFQIPHSFHP